MSSTWIAEQNVDPAGKAATEAARRYRRSDSGPAAVLARLLAAGIWSAADLVEIVGDGWAGRGGQSEALAALLHRAVPAHNRVALGEVWESATASLAGRPGPLTLSTADRLLEQWMRLAGDRADSWLRPRSQRRKKGRRSVHPMGDLSRVAS